MKKIVNQNKFRLIGKRGGSRTQRKSPLRSRQIETPKYYRHHKEDLVNAVSHILVGTGIAHANAQEKRNRRLKGIGHPIGENYDQLPREMNIIGKVGSRKSEMILHALATVATRELRSREKNNLRNKFERHIPRELRIIWERAHLLSKQSSAGVGIAPQLEAPRLEALGIAVEVSCNSKPFDYIEQAKKRIWLCLNIAEGKFDVDSAIEWIRKSRELEEQNDEYRPNQMVIADFDKIKSEKRSKANKFFTNNNTYFKNYLKGRGFSETFEKIVDDLKNR